MSWGVDLVVDHPDGYQSVVEVVDGHTYNLSAMWRQAKIFETSSDLEGQVAGDLAPRLAAGLSDAVANPKVYKALNPPNGWGDYWGFIEILTRFAILCADHPRGVVRWNG